MSRAQRTSQLLTAACHQLHQWRGAKAVSTKLSVELLQDVEGVGPAGKLAKVNHGYARNFLVPNQLALVVPRPRRGHRAAAAAEARSSSGAGAVARQQQAASSSGPLQLSLEKQQQQFDKLIKTLTGAPLTLKRRTKDGQALEQALQAQDIAEAVGRQLRIQLVPELVDLGGESLKVVGEYRLPLKMALPSGERAMLDINVAST